MILNKKFLLVVLMSILLPLSKGYAEKRSSIGLEILGKSISAVKEIYSCAPTMIAGPSKRKIICTNSSETLILAAVKNRIVSATVVQFTTETSINNLLDGYSESCRKSTESNFRLELNCEEKKTIYLELDISDAELRTEFCFFKYCSNSVD